MTQPAKLLPSLLVVEDSQALASLIQIKLSPHFSVKVVNDGQAAIKWATGGQPCDVILLDLVLPKVDGIEVLRTLQARGIKIPVIAMTAQPRGLVENEVRESGAIELLSKPLDFQALPKLLLASHEKSKRISAGEAMVHPKTGGKLPFRKTIKACTICGFDKVTVFQPIEDAYTEDWSVGPYPIYKSSPGYEPWDFLKTNIMVCPYCFFASADPKDFADSPHDPYPYNEESKKILARALLVRKKLLPESKDIDPRFDSPFRNRERVAESFLLAEKCSNGLILSLKPRAYSDSGFYSLMLGVLEHPNGNEYYKEAYTAFQNQLKVKDVEVALIVKANYFSLVLHMLLGRTALGRGIMQAVEQLYFDKQVDEVSKGEQEWLMRIDHVWKRGIQDEIKRDII